MKSGSSGVTIIDGAAINWINGLDALSTMAPAFRDNLGDPERVEGLLSKYWLRPLWIDPVTSRRIDHVRTEPGYQDLSEAYHDSVEESFFLEGGVTLTAEGNMQPGDYFWRPPGWVHSARSNGGFECILMMEGEDPAEGSGRVSRVICADDESGRQVLCPPAANEAERPVPGSGPRGYVRRLETRFLPTRTHDDSATQLSGPGPSPLRSLVLSSNANTRSSSVLVTVPAGWSSDVPATDRERFLIVVGGTLTVDGTHVSPCSLVRIEPGQQGPRVATADGAQLLVKSGSAR